MILRLIAFVAAHTAAYVLFVLSWVVLGRAAFAGDVSDKDLVVWATLLAASVPCHLLATRLQSTVALMLGETLRRRLLRGTLGLHPSEVRGEGVGRFLGRVMETEAVETLTVGGGMLGLVAGVELVLAAIALGTGPGMVTTLILLAWVSGTLLLARRYLRARQSWVDARLDITDDIVAKLLGHRTRLAQQPPPEWHVGENEALKTYDTRARAMDRRLAVLTAAGPRGWVVVGALGLWASASTPGQLAAGAGGILLATGAFHTLSTGLANLADAATAWSNLRPLLNAPQVEQPEADAPIPGTPLISAAGLAFHHPDRDPVLTGANLRIEPGERVAVDGLSGSGKSTLVSLLAGLHTPTAGTLLLQGRPLTSAIRRRVVLAPQFHENHMFLGSLAFNLLLGRGWPASPEDLQDARTTCQRLGLGPLLDRMPSGLHQIVGETGWQLSHGERSLVFLARALLQRADLVILDETLGALDPATQHTALTALAEATDAAPTLIVVHH